MAHVLVTGAAGFIGFHVARRLLARGDTVLGVDCVDDAYDPALKEDRLAVLRRDWRFREVRIDLAVQADAERLFAQNIVDSVVHLAARPGVRQSLVSPHAAVRHNVDAFLHVLEGCRIAGVEHLVYASSSSVYGARTDLPFSEGRSSDHPVSLYAATKKADELFAHAYAESFGLPSSGLRFFTVYGPWGRPDMAMSKFTKAILEGRPIEVFRGGRMSRDFTYIDDVVDGVVAVLDAPAEPDPQWSGDDPNPATSLAPWRVYNVGSQQPVELMDAIRCLERSLGRKATLQFREMQPGDVVDTACDGARLRHHTKVQPTTPLEVGLERFVAWYLDHHRHREAA
jgi:UDP-glucuronate 4-epimerase